MKSYHATLIARIRIIFETSVSTSTSPRITARDYNGNQGHQDECNF